MVIDSLAYVLEEILAKIRRNGYIFITWKGDHSPRHVHVFKDGREILKWDLENNLVMSGTITGKLLKIIQSLVREGEL